MINEASDPCASNSATKGEGLISDEKPKSFWTSFPGILTSIAAVITATAGLLGVLHKAELLGGDSSESAPSVAESPASSPASKPTPSESTHIEKTDALAADIETENRGFRIVEMWLRADPFDYSGPCPVTINFSGRISVAGGGGQVSYKFLRNDGASAAVETLDFESSGSMSVSTTWRLRKSYSGWQSVATFDPSEKQSNKAKFKIICE